MLLTSRPLLDYKSRTSHALRRLGSRPSTIRSAAPSQSGATSLAPAVRISRSRHSIVSPTFAAARSPAEDARGGSFVGSKDSIPSLKFILQSSMASTLPVDATPSATFVFVGCVSRPGDRTFLRLDDGRSVHSDGSIHPSRMPDGRRRATATPATDSDPPLTARIPIRKPCLGTTRETAGGPRPTIRLHAGMSGVGQAPRIARPDPPASPPSPGPTVRHGRPSNSSSHSPRDPRPGPRESYDCGIPDKPRAPTRPRDVRRLDIEGSPR